MGKLEQYKNLLESIVVEWGTSGDSLMETTVDDVIITDHLSGNYILMSVGWWNKKRLHDIVFHARIKDDKIWIEWDGTDPGITDELLRRGVPREDVVFGWNASVESAPMEPAAGD
jgi:hypothetical protein